jgi:hypothetical protein
MFVAGCPISRVLCEKWNRSVLIGGFELEAFTRRPSGRAASERGSCQKMVAAVGLEPTTYGL